VYSAFGGVMRFDAQGKYLQRHDGKFADNKLQSIAEDSARNVWIGTGEGLNLIKKNNDLLRFDEFDGLSSNDLTAGFLLHKNTLFLGQTNGFDVVDLAHFSLKKTFVQPRLCSYQIQDQAPVFNIEAPFVFERDQNTLTFHCSNLDYGQSFQTHYQYKLDNEVNWSTPTTNPTFVFHNLKPEDYRLAIRVGNGTDWNTQPLEINFTIKPYFYETTWFYLLILGMIAATGYAFYRYRINQILRVQTLRERISQDLHDEVGATLSSINILNTIAQSKLKPTHEIWRYLDRITEDTQSLQTKLEEILWSLRRDRDNLPQLVVRIRRFASELFEAKGIDYEFLFDENFDNRPLSMETRQNIYLICKEAINNLLKYSACSKVSIKISIQNRQLNISIADNGRGFDSNVAFEGNGLKNMRRRTEALGGKLIIESKINEGTTVRLQTKITQKGD
jgi:two-component sensor histidine kinase